MATTISQALAALNPHPCCVTYEQIEVYPTGNTGYKSSIAIAICQVHGALCTPSGVVDDKCPVQQLNDLKQNLERVLMLLEHRK